MKSLLQEPWRWAGMRRSHRGLYRQL